MPLSEKAARALEQVTNGLNMLYGADYFTEAEWIKIDGLIHKGEYVFTNGPPTTNFLEDELMSFDEGREKSAPLDMQSQDIYEMATRKEPVEDVKEESKAEEQLGLQHQDEPFKGIEQLSSANPEPSSDISGIRQMAPSTQTPIPQSLEISSDEEQTAPEPDPKTSSEEPSFDLSSDLSNPPSQEPSLEQRQQAFEPPKREPVTAPRNGGLAYYTQEQLDEIKAFNSGLTKAGEKKRPSYRQEANEYPSPDCSEEMDWAEEMYLENNSRSQDYPSPAITDEDNRIQNWASGVNTQATESPKEKLINDFVRAHGRLPKSVNDIYQPRNPAFIPLTVRPVSRATSVRAVKRPHVAKSIASVVEALKPGSSAPSLKVESGTVLIAQHSVQASPGNLRIEIIEGDQIKILKHVSGLLHYGVNLRTLKSGQFPEGIFLKKPAAAPSVAQQQQKAAQNIPIRAANSVSNGMQQFERVNASEWDEIPQLHRPKEAALAPVRPLGGLAASRYAVLADDKNSEDSDGIVNGMTREDVDKLVDEKFEQLLKARQLAPNGPAQTARVPPYRPPSDRRMIEPLKPVQPKTATCWFWATPNKDCRFTADECRDLHAFGPADDSQPSNLRMGKPTWGALADSGTTSPLPKYHNITLASHLQGSKSGFVSVNANASTAAPENPHASKLTCHFWANEGKCSYTAEQCKYKHAWGDGVAKAPRNGQNRTLDWSRWDIPDRLDRQKEESSQNGGWGETSNGWGDESANINGSGANAGNSWDTTGNEESSQNSLANGPLTSWGGSNDNTWGTTTSAADAWGNSGLSKDDSNSASVGAWGDVDSGKPVHVQALEEKARVEAVGW